MLVLSRKKLETLKLHTRDGVIEVTVNRVSGQRVTLAINAPATVRIVRGELEPRDDGTPPTEEAA